MIQRIQTIYLLAALVLQVLQAQLTWVTFSPEEMQYSLVILGSEVTNWFGVMVLGASVFLVLAAVGSFRNRPLQMRLCLLFIASVLLVYLPVWNDFRTMRDVLLLEGAVEVQYHLTVVLPVISIILAVLARSAINRDQILVRSADRIR